jgi:hypothetical protein
MGGHLIAARGHILDKQIMEDKGSHPKILSAQALSTRFLCMWIQ